MQITGAHGPLSPAQSKAVLDKLKAKAADNGILERHVAIEEALAGNPLSTGNKVVLLEDGRATYTQMIAAIRAAKASVHMESYIFEDDEIGRGFAALLKERAHAGLDVRLIYDAVGSIDTPKEFFADLAASGVQVVDFNPIAPSTLVKGGPAELNHRDHRKLTVVDGRTAFLGGINISSVYGSLHSGGSGAPSGGGTSGSAEKGKPYDPRDPPFDKRPWRDTEVRIDGPVVSDLEQAFLAQWARQKKEEVSRDARFFPKIAAQGSQLVRVIEGSPRDEGVNMLTVTLLSAIQNAEKQVRITIAYFVPHPDLLAALRDAAGRGVEVQLILPSRTDNWVVLHAGQSYYEDLLEAGVKIYERKARLLHAKTATIDGVWSTVGSTNLDWRSLLDNDEINAVVLGPEFAVQMNQAFEHDLADSTLITRQAWASRPLSDRLKELAARAWARLL